MPIGFINATNVTLQNITDITNVSSFSELLVNINHDIYQGWFFFIMLMLLWVILLGVAEDVNPQMLVNAMYSGAIVTMISFFLRAIIFVHTDGSVRGLLNDYQLWVFPLLTIMLAGVNWLTRD